MQQRQSQTTERSQLLQNPMKVRSTCTYPVKKVVNVQLELPQHYVLVEKVGQGSFGEIYKLYDTRTNTLHACKVEIKDQRQSNQHQPLLAREYKVLQALSQIPNVPQAYQFLQNADYNLIIMPFFGSGNLEELRKKQRNGCFSKKTTMLLGISLIDALDKVHERNYIHRDIKPENFIVGSAGDQHKVYLIDYGLAKQYVDQSGTHIQMATNKGMVGTARYTSINSHVGLEQSRRDDLEAVGYVLLYLHLGQLPWQNFNCQTRQEKFQKILEQKVKFSSNHLQIDCPIEMKKYFDYIKGLQFDQKPDYVYLKSLFQNALNKINLDGKTSKPSCFDWCPADCTITTGDVEYCDIISNEVPGQKHQGQNKTTFFSDQSASQARGVAAQTRAQLPEIQQQQAIQNIQEEDQSEKKSLIVPDETLHAQLVFTKPIKHAVRPLSP